jgi:hypothetical protein
MSKDKDNNQHRQEPDPVPTEAQLKVREQIAATVKKPPKDASTEQKEVAQLHQAPADQQPNPNTQPEAQHTDKGHVQDGLEPKKD